ncbi:hypothetical protein [Reyranella sp.]|uniref:hypothetical protein n=1 Tax=Reyranella sp. TaxID=1929291 RepID=UPI003BAB5526
MNLFAPFLAIRLLVVGVPLLTGACGAPLAVTGASYAADGALLASSDKTAADHLASMVSKQDCALWRVVRNRSVCRPRDGTDDPYKVDYAEPQRMVAEDGVSYGPPLRAPADAPATSWDVAAYQSEGTPPVPETGAPLADGDRAVQHAAAATEPAAAAPPPAAAAPPAPTAAAKPVKPGKRSVRKSSRGRAGSRS